jgi:hypothetical protein
MDVLVSISISSSSPHYKEMVSIAMAAYATKDSTVDITLRDSCNSFGNAQDMIGLKAGTMPW